MKGHEIPLSKYIEGNKMQLIIPVYQRNYDWKKENCDQLFNDLKKLVHSERNHFFGSIVTGVADSIGNNRLVIDGQQRITTISILLLAAIHASKKGEMEISDIYKIDEATEIFLMAKYCASERKYKLVPIERDMEAYDKVFAGDPTKFVADSKITNNYIHFYELLTKGNRSFTFDELLNAIEKLQIISIELESNDDAQLIFESLNSTGLALTEADKIRNYLLMSLSREEQQEYFKKYWQKIELSTGNEPTMFLRDYLTIIQQLQRPPRINLLYFEWKKYMEERDRKFELAKMLDYAKFYYQATNAQLSTKKLSKKMRQICNIQTDVVNVFFIPFLKYAEDKELSESEIYNVIDLIENFMARRIVCNIPGNALTQVFCALHKDVLKSYEEYKDAGIDCPYRYAEILTYHIMRRDGNYQLPRDIQFIEAIKTRDAYHMPKPFQVFLFERLENAISGEYNDVANQMNKKNASIEHIMPQTLNDEWRQMLGSKYEVLKEKYLHTFANLTLTGINSELSNNSFITKRDGKIKSGTKYPGYKDSIYRLTRGVTECSQWTEAELIKRGQEIVDIFMSLYPQPKTEFKPFPKPIDEISLEDETFNPANRLLRGFTLFGQAYTETTWKSMLLRIVNILSDKYPDTVESLYDAGSYFWKAPGDNEQYCTKISNGKYLWTSMDNKNKLRCLRYLFEKCDIAESELTIQLEAKKEQEE